MALTFFCAPHAAWESIFHFFDPSAVKRPKILGRRKENAAQSMFDTSAEIDGDGDDDDEEADGSDSHEEVNDEDLLDTKELLLPWNLSIA